MDGGEAATQSISYKNPFRNTWHGNLCLLQRDLQVGEDSHRRKQSSLLQRQKRMAASSPKGIPGTSPPWCNQETRYRRGSFVPRLAMPQEPSKKASLWNRMKTFLTFHARPLFWAASNRRRDHHHPPTPFSPNWNLQSSPTRRKNRPKGFVL